MSGQVFLSETRERFLKAILAELPVEQVREIYLFQPMKQGGVESGVAVVAGEAFGEGRSAFGEEADTAAGAEPEAAPPPEGSPVPAGQADAGSVPDGEHSTLDFPPASPEDAVPPDAPTPNAERPTPEADRPTPDADRPTPNAERYTVYSARYRYVLKGPDRGKWEASVTAEADAPLVSIESVVRGVQRRAGDVDAPEHMSADEIRAALRLGPPAASDAA